MSRYDDASLDQMIGMTGWDNDSVISLYESFIAARDLEDEFADFCRAQADEELTAEEHVEDYEAACEEAGGPVCPQCHVVYTGIPSQSHKMDCGIGRADLKKYVEQIPQEGIYYECVRLYVDAIEEDE